MSNFNIPTQSSPPPYARPDEIDSMDVNGLRNLVKELTEHIKESNNQQALIAKELDWFLNGNISSQNAREIGGWKVGSSRLVSKLGDVGMSSEHTVSDDVRFWAGSAVKETAPWRVHKSGVMYSTGGVFQSAAGYPKVALNLNNNIIAAYADADTYVAFIPNLSGVPALALIDAATTKAFLNRSLGVTTLGTFDSEPLNFQPSGNLQIGGVSGASGTVFVSSASGGPADMAIEFTKGIRTG